MPLTAVLFAGAALLSQSPDVSHRTWLSDVRPVRRSQGWGELRIDEGLQGPVLAVGSKKFPKGIATHADGVLVYALGRAYNRFQALVGIDAGVGKYRDTPEWKGGKHPSVVFRVVADGKTLFESKPMLLETPAALVDVSVKGVDRLELIVNDAGDGNYGDWSVWGEAVLIGPGPANLRPVDRTRAYTVPGKDLQVELSKSGAIVGLKVGAKRKRVAALGYSSPAGLAAVGQTTVKKLEGGGLAFSRKLKGGSSVERFEPTADGVRWTIELKTQGKPWSAPIETAMVWPKPSRCKVWTAWGNEYEWSDPLVPKAFGRMDIEYGAFFNRKGGTALPLVTILDGDLGFSMIQSPEDPLIDMNLLVDPDGRVAFSRTSQRLGEGRTWRFSVDLVVHPADPRSALAWIVKRYPKLFDPPLALADEVGGGGAYSGYEGEQDVEKLKRMGFTFNWKASVDFPYMGMFLPPIPNDQRFNRFAGGGGGGYGPGDEGRFGTTSATQLNDYAKRMKADGFHVLSYFNVTEFGGNIDYPAPPRVTPDNDILWQSPNDFLYSTFPKAILRTPDRPIWTWGGAVIMDCGETVYRDFLLAQAERNIRDLSATDGICIDRMDWLVQYNPHADDGLSWADGPARHLCRSWLDLMDRLGPMMHKAGKVIFVNDMTRRIELMKHVDGVYDEHGDYGYNLNTSSFLCLRKPLTCWTRSEDQLKPDPDKFIQRHLYMGAFMTVPLAANDHTILPSPSVDRLYLDYGPMFRALHGRKWVLLPHVVSASAGKANVFQTKAGYVVPVVFGGNAEVSKVVLRGLPSGLRAEIVHPGGAAFAPIAAKATAGRLEIDVPLVRGCAFLRLR